MKPGFYAIVALMLLVGNAQADPATFPCWKVDDLKPGLKGTGLTVFKGTKIETFDVEILGVMKNTAPGRDMVIARLSGLGLEKSGVIAGMSGSPVTIDGKLVGAVAYAWEFGKEPIAGITPFAQMRQFVEAFEERDRADDKSARKVSLRQPIEIDGTRFKTVAVASIFAKPEQRSAAATDELWMVPLQTPVAASGFTPHSLQLFRERFGETGLFPVMGGATSARILDEEKNVVLEPGGSLALSVVTGDFDISGIGTVTAIDGDRVYGWGHPFMGLGACEFPMMTGYVHTIFPRQTVSFKMGSPLKMVGVINADVSTCIAGRIGRKPDMIPVKMNVRREVGDICTFNVNIVRQRSLLPSLLYTVLTNAVDMEGDLPDEMSADITLKIDIEGRAPLVLRDTFSGSSFSGGRAPNALYAPIAQMAGAIHSNPFGPVRITGISCETVIHSGRITAEIESVELDADTVALGENLKATVHLRPWKSNPIRERIELNLPADLPAGSYSLTISDDLTRARNDLRDRPDINLATSVETYLSGLEKVVSAKRTMLAARVPLTAAGVVVDGNPLPNLPPGMVQMLGQTRRTGAQLLGTSLSTRKPTDWVITGSETVSFTVAPKRSTMLRVTKPMP